MTFGQFFQENILLFLMLAGVIGAIIALEIRDRGNAGKKIGNVQAAMLINDGSVLVDLRSPTDFKNGHIAGAVNMSAEGLSAALARKPNVNKEKAVLLYDADGLSAGKSAKALVADGYSNVQILDAGFSGWVGDNLPVVQK